MNSAVQKYPPTWLLFSASVLTGTATTLLGPILPLLMHHWHLQDRQAGLLFAAQFLGAFTGGISINHHLRRALLISSASAVAGWGIFAIAIMRNNGLPLALAALLLAGFGVGHLLTATNLVIGERNAHRRGSGLTLLNAFFSAGAILSSLVIGNLALRLPLTHLIFSFAGCFALIFAGFVTHNLQTRSSAAILSDNTQSSASQQFLGINLRVLLFFAAMLFLYGGVETSINSWISTYTVRHGSAALWLGVASASAFWIAITAGRAISVAMLARVSERIVLSVSLTATAFALYVVIFVHTGWQIAAASLLTGLCLAPVFPTNFSLLLAQRPRARQAGSILAVSGLGAAFLPWATGIVSTHTSSLQAGLVLPLLATLALLMMSLVTPRSTTR